jgi:hypothetical protein
LIWREIAEMVGAELGVPVRLLTPEEAPRHFGQLGTFVGMDLSASSAKTRERLDWQPAGPRLIEDLERMEYSRPAAAEQGRKCRRESR